MEEITAQKFYEMFKTKLLEKQNKVKELYYSGLKNELETHSGETPWTKFANREIIPEIIDSFLNTSIESKHKYVYQEFFKIDNTGWSYIDKENIDPLLKTDFNNTGMNWHLWNLEIAVEHENDPKDWFYEVIKLLPFDCKLRVVIGYNNIKNRQTNSVASDEKKLEIVLNQIKLLDKGIDKLKHGKFLIIIGNYGGGGENNKYDNIKDMCGYKGYIYDKNQDKFIEL